MKTANRFSKDMSRKLAIIEALVFLPNPSMSDLCSTTGIPAVSIQRQLRDLRKNYLMRIEYTRALNTQWKDGYYAISNWGVLNEVKILELLEDNNS